MERTARATHILASRDAGGGLRLVELDGAPEAHERVGQYVAVATEVGADADKAYFAIASAPRAASTELLVRAAPGLADKLAAAESGAPFFVSAALGPGFAPSVVESEALVVAVTAGALGVARPVVEARARAGRSADTHVYLGARTFADLPLVDELAEWIARGVRVTLCLSRDGVAPAPFVAERGYVQDVLRRHAHDERLGRGASALVAGPDAMVAAVRALAGDGVLASVTTNF